MEPNVTIQWYKVFYTRAYGGGAGVKNVTASNNSTVLTGLQSDISYNITVLAYSSLGDGPNSTAISVKTLPAPG